MSQTLHAGQATVQTPQNLCDKCHMKPKFGQFNYCSKTCAAQVPSKVGAPAANTKFAVKPRTLPPASNLCDYCKKAPKHPGHDFCGKSCAQNAKAGPSSQSASKAAPNTSIPGKPNANQSATSAVAQAVAAAAANTAGGTIDPTQIANLVVQQLQTLLPPMGPASTSSGGVPAGNGPRANTSGFYGSTKQASQPASYTSSISSPQQLRVQTQAPTQSPEPEDPPECLIPGCGQPAYVDAKGSKSSAYCSMRHRQEAVDSGLASPCIFCLQLPQSDTDYFCGKECREESLNKQGQHEIVDL